ncbi:hypothetical protein, partial [Ruegeria lacuscaerulensis]|uniref:hypothetical protein n=1 Tax=Ruegeria lacuscaerulensis TaxID=55218 RepID=UPI001BE4D09C
IRQTGANSTKVNGQKFATDPGDDPSFLYSNDYGACTSERFIGSPENIIPAITTAFKNCVR